jgi:drug/metabolite transporter (DMT)-like permease
MSVPAALALALASTILLDLSYLLQQRSAERLEHFSPRHPVMAFGVLLQARLWVVGAVLGIGGFVASLVAIALADLSLVQAASASGIAVLAVVAVLWFGQRLTGREKLGIVLITGGLVALGLTLQELDGPRPAPDPTGVMVWVTASVVVAVLLGARPGGRFVSRAAAAGIAAGMILGAGRVATKGLFEGLPDGAGLADVASSPFLYLTIVVYAAGVWAQNVAFQRGEAVNAISLLVASTSVVPIIAGLVVFDDPLPAGGLDRALRLGGLALVLAGAALLAVRVMMGPADLTETTPSIPEPEAATSRPQLAG